MARIDLSTFYQEYLQTLVKSGRYRSITAAAEAAIHQQMLEDEKRRVASIALEVAKGEKDIKEGNIVEYHPGLINDISTASREENKSVKSLKSVVRPE